MSAPNPEQLAAELALAFAKVRTGCSVFMDGSHNPTRTEQMAAAEFVRWNVAPIIDHRDALAARVASLAEAAAPFAIEWKVTQYGTELYETRVDMSEAREKLRQALAAAAVGESDPGERMSDTNRHALGESESGPT